MSLHILSPVSRPLHLVYGLWRQRGEVGRAKIKKKRRDGQGDIKRRNKLFCLAGVDSKERRTGNGRMEANAL